MIDGLVTGSLGVCWPDAFAMVSMAFGAGRPV
jgi:hypothetical protein